MSTRHRSKKSIQGAKHLRELAVAAAIVLRVAGCQVLTYNGPKGEHLSHTSVGGTSTQGSLAVEAGSNGIQRIEFRSCTNDAARALGTVMSPR